MKSPLHHLKHPEWLFDYFHKKIHHAFGIFGLSILWMLWGASNILTITSANWQWWGFITYDFWEQNPTNENIMYTLFGDGTPWATAYTRLWDTSCVATTIRTLPSWYTWWSLSEHTIYILNAWTYTLTTPISMDSCSALLGKGNVVIKTNVLWSNIIVTSKNNIILDNILINGKNNIPGGIFLQDAQNISLNNIKSYNNMNNWMYISNTTGLAINNSYFFKNNIWINISDQSSHININNSLAFNNAIGIDAYNANYITINNTQTFNNTTWLHLKTEGLPSWKIAIHNSLSYNNSAWIVAEWISWYFHDVKIYNNNQWIVIYSGWVSSYGYFQLFANTIATWWTQSAIPWSLSLLDREAGVLNEIYTWFSYDWVTNPQNGNGQWLLSGVNLSILRGIQSSFDYTQIPIRYIFWGNISKQVAPVWYNDDVLETYGTDVADYTTTKYITEPESSLSSEQQLLVNHYFGSGSIFTQNWQTNWCSLSAFQVKTLAPGDFTSPYLFEDHTLYILSDGEYRSALAGTSTGFIFNGNCIALIGTSNTKFDKTWLWGMNSLLYAYNKRNIILDTLSIDGLYYHAVAYSPAIRKWIFFDGANNNSTINNVQVYNTLWYGIFLGLGSHHNTIINSQTFNNSTAGIHLYYTSNYNVINNTQTYNNGSYGIWFANGSKRNTINNVQWYNNAIGIFWDLTTQENVFNRVALYNNSTAGISLKNSSGNIFNDIRLYNNTVGIASLYSSIGNTYYWELQLFDNWEHFNWTNGNDTYLSVGMAGIFPYGGILSTGSNLISCLYATNPTLSGSTTTLLNSNCTTIGMVPTFQSLLGNTSVNYAFWLHMYKQKIPYAYETDGSLIQIPWQYDASKYIAEVFAIRDSTPEWVSFLGSWWTQLNTWYTTNIYTASVLNIPVPVTLSFDPITTSGYLIISWHAIGLTGIVNNWDTLQIYILTRTGYNQTITGNISIWSSLINPFIVTTRWYSQTPTTGSLLFAALTNVPLGILTGNTITVNGIETWVLASITFTPNTTSGWLEIYSGSVCTSSWTTWLLVYNGNQLKTLTQSSSGYLQTITWYVTIWLGTGIFTITTKWSDNIPPTTPVITYPLSWEEIFFTRFEWNASVDTGSWIGWYFYEIATDNTFVDTIHTGFIVTTTGTFGSPSTDFDVSDWKYYWRMQAKDKEGNLSIRSNTGYFRIWTFDDRDFVSKEDANLRTYYDSNEITIDTLKNWVSIWATLEGDATLYKNGNDIWTGTFVQNGDDIYITMRSSSKYNKTISSTLRIANRLLEFSIQTKQETDDACSLSDTDKESIQIIFDSLVENYSEDENKFDEFLSTMKSMLADEIDFTNDCNLQYLEDLINGEIGNDTWNGSIDTSAHIAPNCKEYSISFDNLKLAYTSPNFTIATYFANRDCLIRYIDSKNPGDCHVNVNTYSTTSWSFTNTDPSKHIAPNGKVYSLYYNWQWYTSNEFTTVKYFTSIATLRTYIDSKNIPQAIRSHEVDTYFSPQSYIAPNGKEYIIYKTDRWYMSYKLLKVRYFSSLAEIQSFIGRNNSK